VAATIGSGVASVTPIRAGRAESADMSLSDRQRPEGFHLSMSTAVWSAVAVSFTRIQQETTDKFAHTVNS